MNLVTYQKT